MNQSISTIDIERLAHMWMVDSREHANCVEIDNEAIEHFINYLGDNKFPGYKDVRRWKSSLYYAPDFSVRAKKEPFGNAISKFVTWIEANINKTDQVNDPIQKPEIQETTDYSIFKRMSANRPLNEGVVRKLVKSMKDEVLPVPIIVNEKCEVVDGQHRLEACKRANMPVYYIVVPGVDENTCKRLNQDQSGWKSADFLNYYAQLGSRAAARILDVAKLTGLPSRTVFIAAGKPATPIQFWSNGYKESVDWDSDDIFSELDKERAINCIDSASRLIASLGGMDKVRKTTFYNVWSIFYYSGVVDEQRMIRSVAKYSTELWKLNKTDLARKLVSVYNRRHKAPFLDLEGDRKTFAVIQSDKNCWRDFH